MSKESGLNFVNHIKSSLKTRDKASYFLYIKAYTQYFIISTYYHIITYSAFQGAQCEKKIPFNITNT